MLFAGLGSVRMVKNCDLEPDVTKTGNGEWGMGNGEWGMGNGEWGMGNGEWGMGNGEWEIENGKWEIENGKLTFFTLTFYNVE